MQIEISPSSRTKLESILEELYTYYDMEDLTPQQLVDAFLDLGIDLLVADEASMPGTRERLLQYCRQKVQQV